MTRPRRIHHRFFPALLLLLAAGCSEVQPTIAGPEGSALQSVTAATPHPMNAAYLEGFRLAAHSADGAIVDNGVIQLGVLVTGNLGMWGGTASSGWSSTTAVGVRYMPTNSDATSPGCICEGWGVADAGTGAFGAANVDVDGVRNLVLESFTHTGSEATSVVLVNDGGEDVFRVTHAYRPSGATTALYEVTVTIENISGVDVSDLRYTRTMDWDIAPNTFYEFVTIQGAAAAANVLYSSNNGFNYANPLEHRWEPDMGDFENLGPDDHGAHFDFGFGELPAGESKVFTTFYGAAANQASALAALGAVGAEVYSFGQASYDGSGWVPAPESGAPTGSHGYTTGEPHTFIFAFKGVGGDVVVPPDPVESGHDGCSAGFWSQHGVRTDAYPDGYSPEMTVGALFPQAAGYLGDATLQEALDGYKASRARRNTVEAAAELMLRQAVAAVLNEAALGDDYPAASVEAIKTEVAAALTSGERSALTDVTRAYDRWNNGLIESGGELVQAGSCTL